MKFTVYGKPRGKKRVGRGKDWHAYKPNEDRDYEDSVCMAFIAAGGRMIPKGVPVSVEITAWYAIPKSTTKQQRERMVIGQVVPTVKPDWDNVGKIVCDALNGIAWHDDAQVAQATVRKLYGSVPMVTVVIQP